MSPLCEARAPSREMLVDLQNPALEGCSVSGEKWSKIPLKCIKKHTPKAKSTLVTTEPVIPYIHSRYTRIAQQHSTLKHHCFSIILAHIDRTHRGAPQLPCAHNQSGWATSQQNHEDEPNQTANDWQISFCTNQKAFLALIVSILPISATL